MAQWDAETAEWYAEKYGEYPTNRLALDELDLPVDATVVDIGCGTGSALRHAAARITEGSLIGIDPVPRMIEIAKERTLGHPGSERIEFRLGSAEKLPAEDHSAALVFAFDSIDHWQDVQQGLCEVRRVLAPGGMLLVVKDGAVPGAARARRQTVATLDRVGFELVAQRELEAEGVRFILQTYRKT